MYEGVRKMAVFQKSPGGVYYYSVYIPGSSRRLRGTCRTDNRAKALMVESVVRASMLSDTSRDSVEKILRAIFNEDSAQKDDMPLDQIYFDFERIAGVFTIPVSKNTERVRKREICAFGVWCEEFHPRVATLRQVDRVCAQAYTRHIIERGCSNKTVRNIIGTLSAIWNILAKGHDNLSNPWPLAMPPRAEEGARDAFTSEQVQAIIKAADTVHRDWGLICRLAVVTGLRFGDLVTLRYSNIMDGVIYITPSKTQRHSIKVRTPLPPDILRRIGEGEGYIFPELFRNWNGEQYNGRPRFKEIMDMAGVTGNLTFHSFRHTFRTKLSEVGIPEAVAMRLGGWTQAETARHYDHAELIDEKREAVGKIAALLS